MDAWVIAFIIPNLARRLFGEGAAASSFIPVYSQQLQRNPKNAKRLACTVLTTVLLALTAIVLLGEIIIWTYYRFFSSHPSTNLKLALSSLMLPYMVLVCLVAILAAILNAHRHFAAPAAAPIVLNIFIIITLCLGGWTLNIAPARLVFLVAAAVLLAGLAQIAIQIPPLHARKIHIRPAWDVHSEPFKKIIILMAPMIIGLTVTQINTLTDNFIAMWFSGSEDKGHAFSCLGFLIDYPLWEGAVSQLFYAQRLYQFPLGVLGISLATAIFPVMSTDAARNDMNALAKTISNGLRTAIFVALPATLGLLLVGKPLISVIFQRGQFAAQDTTLTATVLYFYAIGLCGFFMQQITTRAFYSIQDSKTPMRNALLAVAANLVLNLTLIWFIGTAGLALSTALCSYLQVVILVLLLRRRFGPAILHKFATSLIKTAIASLTCFLLGAAILYTMKNLPGDKTTNLLRLAAAVPAAVISYLVAAKLLRIEMLTLLTSRKPNPLPPGQNDIENGCG